MAQLSERMRRLVQPHLATIEPYDPHFTPTRINLSANENTYRLPVGIQARIDRAIAATPLNRYPDPLAHDLRRELAAWHAVAPEQLCVGNGGDELLYNFLLAFGGRGRAVLIAPPCFSEYAFFAELTETAVRAVPRDAATFAPEGERLIAEATNANLVILTSPNNPTGDVLPLDVVHGVCHACPGLVMVDEAYIEFADDAMGAAATVQGLLDDCPNLVILHTLSKAFGMAGARLGYVIAASDIIEVFDAVRQLYSVNVLTQAAALAAVRERDEFAPVVAQIAFERERMAQRLRDAAHAGLPVTVWPSRANFLLVRVPHAHRTWEMLRDEFSILVRDFSETPGLANCLRITVGTPEENERVFVALDTIVRRG